MVLIPTVLPLVLHRRFWRGRISERVIVLDRSFGIFIEVLDNREMLGQYCCGWVLRWW